jgi:hypothetical protein
MPRIPDKCRLLHGSYHAPALSRGDRVTCHLRGTVVITTWTDARISWPRCRPLESKGGSGVLLDDEMARAVRTEAAAAVGYWWGVTVGVVWRWRKALAVTKKNNPRTYQLLTEASQAGADKLKAKEWTEEEREVKREINQRLGLTRNLRPSYHDPSWMAEERKLLGEMPDAEVARRIGRTVDAVRIERERRGIPNPVLWGWTAEDIAQLGTETDAEVAGRIGRTPSAVAQKRIALGIPPARSQGRPGR